MPELTANGQIADDAWRVLTLSDHETPEQVRLPVGPLLVPTAVWRARRAELFRRENDHNWPLGVWLDAEEKPEAIAGDLDDLAVIAVHVRDRSEDQYHRMVSLLRQRYGYTGQLRAIGEVRQDGSRPARPNESRFARPKSTREGRNSTDVRQ